MQVALSGGTQCRKVFACAAQVRWNPLRYAELVTHEAALKSMASITMTKDNGMLHQEGPENEIAGTEESEKENCHMFSDWEVTKLRHSLLAWYDKHRRDLPWRNLNHDDVNQQAYGVWVSEVMLQQTQVATVIDYYNRWMKKWPTLQDLAAASVEEVNEAWTGLGYYSRGRRLLEGAQKVVKEMGGQMPKTAVELEKKLPGVGRYSAGAIASIALGQVTGIVDGNVVRVLSRLRSIGADSTQRDVQDTIWSLANRIVDPTRPGDFNQSLMELGATVCTAKNPSCARCPVQELCSAYARVEMDKRSCATKLLQHSDSSKAKSEVVDIECLIPDCKLCLPSSQPWDRELGVLNFPRKSKKSAVKQEDISVVILKSVKNGCGNGNSGAKFLICQRPQKGLLAGMWEFPTCDHQETSSQLIQTLSGDTGISKATLKTIVSLGKVSHQFSHIHHHYHVWLLTLSAGQLGQLEDGGKYKGRPSKWVTEEMLSTSAMSVGMRKVFKMCQAADNGAASNSKRKRERSVEDVSIQSPKKTQSTISSFFTKK